MGLFGLKLKTNWINLILRSSKVMASVFDLRLHPKLGARFIQKICRVFFLCWLSSRWYVNSAIHFSIVCGDLEHPVLWRPAKDKSFWSILILVGGECLPSILFSQKYWVAVIIPIDELIFFKGVAQPPTSHRAG